MWPRFHISDIGVIAHYLGTMIIVLGFLMALPLLISIIMGEWEISVHYVMGMGVALISGAALRLCKINPHRLERRQAIAVTGLGWIVGALIAAVPLFLSGHYGSFIDALFEGVSGLTATGLTMIQDVDHMSMADQMWRFSMQFVGGQGVVVIALSMGLFSKQGTEFYNAEGREESIVPNIKKTAIFIMQFSFVIVAIGTVILATAALFLGLDPVRSLFHGLWISIGTYDTGGFAPQSLSITYYHSWVFEILAMLFMMLGAINFSLYAYVAKGDWREFFRDLEVRTLALWIIGMVIVFVAALIAGDYLNDYSGLVRRGVFTIISATTNTGYQILSTDQITSLLGSGAFFLIALSMAIGGSASSTAGGIKALRVGLIAKGIVARIKAVLLPQSARITTTYNHIGKRAVTNDLLAAALVIGSLYVITYVIGSLVAISYGYDAVSAAFESISAASNAGLSSGIVSPAAPLPLKLFYIIEMWMGRLEFITLLALFASIIASLAPKRKIKLRRLKSVFSKDDQQ